MERFKAGGSLATNDFWDTHKDECKEKYKKEGKFPSAYIKENDLQVFISQAEMNAIKNQHELMDLVTSKLEQNRA